MCGRDDSTFWASTCCATRKVDAAPFAEVFAVADIARGLAAVASCALAAARGVCGHGDGWFGERYGTLFYHASWEGHASNCECSVAVECDLTTQDHQSVRWQGAQPQESNDGLGVDVTTVAFIFMYVDVISGGEGLSQMMHLC